MNTKSFLRNLALAGASALALSSAHAQTVQHIGKIWYIILENRNFTENETSGGQQLFGSTRAPFINSLINPSSTLSSQVSWCTAYHNVLAAFDGSGPSIHPSEPNYVWFENGSNLSKADDNDPYGTSFSVKQIQGYLAANPALSSQNLTALLQNASLTWHYYNEDVNQLNGTSANANPTSTTSNTNGVLSETPAASSLWTVPLVSFSGTSSSYINTFNGEHQWNFAVKHDGSLFFPATNGCTTSSVSANLTTTNTMSANYPPLAQLSTDLTNGTSAQFNVIIPDQFNDMHTALTQNFTYAGTTWTVGDDKQVAQGDNFLSIIVPQIMASADYQNNGAIVIWTDETEGTNQNDFNHTLLEIVISPLAKGHAYASTLNYTHSTDLNTLQKIYQVSATTPTGFLNDAANPSNPTPGNLIGVNNSLNGAPSGYGTGQAYDLSDLFVAGTIPSTIPVSANVTQSGFTLNKRTNKLTETVTVQNNLSTAITTPVYLALNNLSTNTSLVGATGTTVNTAPVGTPYVLVTNSGLAVGHSLTVTLTFTVPSSGTITYNPNVILTSGTP